MESSQNMSAMSHLGNLACLLLCLSLLTGFDCLHVEGETLPSSEHGAYHFQVKGAQNDSWLLVPILKRMGLVGFHQRWSVDREPRGCLLRTKGLRYS